MTTPRYFAAFFQILGASCKVTQQPFPAKQKSGLDNATDRRTILAAEAAVPMQLHRSPAQVLLFLCAEKVPTRSRASMDLLPNSSSRTFLEGEGRGSIHMPDRRVLLYRPLAATMKPSGIRKPLRARPSNPGPLFHTPPKNLPKSTFQFQSCCIIDSIIIITTLKEPDVRVCAPPWARWTWPGSWERPHGAHGHT
jgi:hypothetical protein